MTQNRPKSWFWLQIVVKVKLSLLKNSCSKNFHILVSYPLVGHEQGQNTYIVTVNWSYYYEFQLSFHEITNRFPAKAIIRRQSQFDLVSDLSESVQIYGSISMLPVCMPLLYCPNAPCAPLVQF